MKKQLLLILCWFAFTLKAQTNYAKIHCAAYNEISESGLTQFKVYEKDCKIFFSLPEELGSKENLELDLYNANEELVSTNCIKCCQFIDVSMLATGNYQYSIKSGNEILASGKLLLN